jgi:hypothetical protein
VPRVVRGAARPALGGARVAQELLMVVRRGGAGVSRACAIVQMR